MSSLNHKDILKQALLLPFGLAWLAFQIGQELTAVGRKYARYWLAVMFALPLVILSSGTSCFIWCVTALLSRGWIPWSAWIRECVNNAVVYCFLFGHGSMLKMLFLVLGLYAFGPVPSPALHFVALDLDATSAWLTHEIWDAAPSIGPVGLDWTKFIFYCMAYRQFTNVLAETDAWETIVNGSVLKPRLMRIVIHFQVTYAIAVVCYLRRQLFDIQAEARQDSEKEELLRRFMHEFMAFKAQQEEEGMQQEDEGQGQHRSNERPRTNKKRRGKPRRGSGAD